MPNARYCRPATPLRRTRILGGTMLRFWPRAVLAAELWDLWYPCATAYKLWLLLPG
jgi:hypothetical protein